MMGLPIARECPFCGSPEVDECIKETETIKEGRRVNIVFMKCYVCDASSKAFAFVEGTDGDAEDGYWEAWGHALDAWNRRADRC